MFRDISQWVLAHSAVVLWDRAQPGNGYGSDSDWPRSQACAYSYRPRDDEAAPVRYIGLKDDAAEQ